MNDNHEGALARMKKALIAGRIAVATVTPLSGAVGPVPSPAVTPNRDEAPTSRVVHQDAVADAGRALEAQGRERRRSGLDLGTQLRAPAVVDDPDSRKRRRER